jgi:hypothetical protein
MLSTEETAPCCVAFELHPDPQKIRYAAGVEATTPPQYPIVPPDIPWQFDPPPPGCE